MDQQKLIGVYHTWLRMVNWLTISTHPDLATITSLLASYQCTPNPGHLDGLKHVGKYIKAMADHGLLFSSQCTMSLGVFVHFPLQDLNLAALAVHAFADVNWGPQNASVPTPTNIQQISMKDT